MGSCSLGMGGGRAWAGIHSPTIRVINVFMGPVLSVHQCAIPRSAAIRGETIIMANLISGAGGGL